MSKFLVQGGIPLKGTVKVHGSKNAALPILAATLLTDKKTTLHNVPDISDVHAFLHILEGLGAETTFENGTVTVHPASICVNDLPTNLVKQMRASILLMGPLLARCKKAKMAFPGGCVLGKRSVHAHTHALESLGATFTETDDGLEATTSGLIGTKIIMAEASVTATENAIMAAVLAEGNTAIHWAAMEPHVQDLCHFLVSMGAKIEGIGSHTIRIQGVSELRGTEHSVISDYLVTGTLAIAALITRGHVTLTNIQPDHLDSFWQKLEEAGAPFTLTEDSVTLTPLPEGEHFKHVEQLKTAVFPGFATDLQAPFTVFLTQAEGPSKVFETLFEGRLNYLFELDRMGAKTELHNPQQATIHGPTKLKGAPIVSCDIRAGAAMVLAALAAEGETEISDIRYIDRGYERLDEILRSLGANIKRIRPV